MNKKKVVLTSIVVGSLVPMVAFADMSEPPPVVEVPIEKPVPVPEPPVQPEPPVIPEPQPEPPKPEPEPQPEPEPPKPEPKPEPRPEPKPEPKPQPKPEQPKPEQPKQETKPVEKLQPKIKPSDKDSSLIVAADKADKTDDKAEAKQEMPRTEDGGKLPKTAADQPMFMMGGTVAALVGMVFMALGFRRKTS